MTMFQMAMKAIRLRLLADKTSYIEGSTVAHLIMQILNQLKSENKLKYFNEISMSVGLSSKIHQAIMEFRMEDVEPDEIDVANFVAKEKGEDFKIIYNSYIDKLRELLLIDESDVYRLAEDSYIKAKETMPFRSGTILLLLSNVKISKLQQKFLDSMKDVQVIPMPISNVKNGVNTTETEEINENESRLTWLYDVQNAPTKSYMPEIELFKAYGEINEARELLSRIRKQTESLDKTLIILTSKEPYTQILYDYSRKLDLPITFGGGISILNTSSGRLVLGLLNWISDNYPVRKLYSLMKSEDFVFPKLDEKMQRNIARILIDAEIFWDRERYVFKLQKCIERYNEKNLKSKDLELKQKLTEDIETTENAVKYLQEVFNRLPMADNENKISYINLIDGLKFILTTHSNLRNDREKEAQTAILSQLEELKLLPDENLKVEEAVARLEKIIVNLCVENDSPKAGYIHVTHYKSGLFINREKTYILGLDSGKFPGIGKSNPALLDVELEKNGLKDKNTDNALNENIIALLCLLSHTKGKIVAGYSHFDIQENKTNFPAGIMLQMYRMLTGDASKEYTDLINYLPDRGFAVENNDDFVDENDVWLHNYFFKNGVNNQRESLMECFEGLKIGIPADEHKRLNQFGDYDGKVKVDIDKVDPRKSGCLVSASQLETFCKCSYRYFLKYILKIEEPPQIEFDPDMWLDPAKRGSLMHDIFESFYSKVTKMGERPSLNKHSDFLTEIAEEFIVNKKKEYPPHEEMVYNYEKDEILNSCRMFLKVEEENSANIEPSYFELGFGMEDRSGIGRSGAVQIDLPSGDTIHILGRIDRVDKVDTDTYRIVDYKTGSTREYKEKEFFKKGKQMQHFLYSIALENILKEKRICLEPKVTEAIYLFPTLKGEGEQILRTQDKKDKGFELIERILDALVAGNYAMSLEDGECSYCKYASACRRHLVKDLLADKLQDPNVKELEVLRGIGLYE